MSRNKNKNSDKKSATATATAPKLIAPSYSEVIAAENAIIESEEATQALVAEKQAVSTQLTTALEAVTALKGADTEEAKLAVFARLSPELLAMLETTKPEVEVIRPVDQVMRECFKLEEDGETLTLIPGSAPKAVELADLIKSKAQASNTASVQAAWVLHVAKSNKDNGASLRRCNDRMDDGSLSASTVANIRHLSGFIPFKLEHGIKAPLNTLKEVIAAVRDKQTKAILDTPAANAILTALKSGEIETDGEVIPVTSKAIKALRATFDANGQPVAKSLPAPKEGDTLPEASDTATQSTAPSDSATDTTDNETDNETDTTIDNSEPIIAPPVVNKSVDPAKDERDKAFMANCLLHLDRALDYIKTKPLDTDERNSVVTRLQAAAIALGLTLK